MKRVLKRTICFCITAQLILAGMPQAVFAAETPAQNESAESENELLKETASGDETTISESAAGTGTSYDVSGGTVTFDLSTGTITGSSNCTNLVIPATLGGKAVTSIGVRKACGPDGRQSSGG